MYAPPPLPHLSLSPSLTQTQKSVLTTQKVLRAAHALAIPYLVTTQNASRLGPTVAELAPFLAHPLCRAQVDKTRFSMWLPSLTQHIPPPSLSSSESDSTTTEIILVGIESHICITQTALDALAAASGRSNIKVYVLADAVSSCNKQEVPLALARLRAEGVTVTTSESWMYEAVGDAGRPEFKDIIKIVKDTVKDTQSALCALAPVPLSSTATATAVFKI